MPLGARDWRIGAAVGLVFLVFYTGFTQARFKSTDEFGLFLMTQSLFEHASLEVPIHRHAHVGADGRLHAPFAIGQAVLALPLYALGKAADRALPRAWVRALAGPDLATERELPALSVARIAPALPPGIAPVERTVYGGAIEISSVGLYAPIASAVLAAGLFLLLRRLGASLRAALLTVFAIGVCSYPAMMSVYFLGHVSELAAVVFALHGFRTFRETGRRLPLALGSGFASAAFLVRFPGVLAGPALALYLAHCLRERWRREPRRSAADLAAAGAPLCAAVALHVGTNYLQWGSPIASPVVAGGFEANDSFSAALAAFLVAPGISVFAYSPLLLLSPWTLRAAIRRWPWECAAIATFALTQLLYYAHYRYWTGLWSAPGPRYLFPSCALLLLPLAAWLEARPPRPALAAAAALAALGATAQLALLTADWQEVSRPLHAAASPAAADASDVDREPDFSFLFDPAASPILGSARAVAAGQIDTWLWKLARGWPGEPARPAVALALALLWAAGSGVGAWGLWRATATTGPGT
jgi:hypothetical protein